MDKNGDKDARIKIRKRSFILAILITGVVSFVLISSSLTASFLLPSSADIDEKNMTALIMSPTSSCDNLLTFIK